jgi:AraC-like DNA-binding protein
MRAKVNYWLAPGLRSVEMTAADYVAQRFSRHWHTGFAIGMVTRNAQGFGAQGREWTIGAGDLIVLNPGQIHDGYSMCADGWSSRMAYIPEDTFAALMGHPATGDGVPLRFTQAVVHAPALSQSFLSWHQFSEETRDVREHRLTAELFSRLLLLMKPGTVGRAVDVLGSQLASLATHGDASVASLNVQLGLTRYGSWRRVKNQFGLAPKPLLNHMRLMSAKGLIAGGTPVIEAALDCGYHDQSHFSRQFAAAYGFTPAQFRRAQLSVA